MQESRIKCGIPGGIKFSSQVGKVGSHHLRQDPAIPTWDPGWDCRDPAWHFTWVAVSDTKEISSESDDADVHELLATTAENDSEGTKTSSPNSQDSCKNEGEDKLLKKLALDFSKDDKVSRPISMQLAEIINKRWASKLGENKVKETVEK